MRLIDADSITEKIMNVFEEALRIALKSGTFDLEGVMLKIKCYLDNQPTAFDVDKVVEQIEKQKNLIDKWEKRLEILDEVYIKNLRDKIETKEKKFNKHMTVITRINELEMCIKDLKQLGGVLDEKN